ncbi:MAG: hypothetical protein Q8P12_05175 [bacterium]|nr:hypothetical protein [bacterium]
MKRFFPIFAFALGLLISIFLLPVISGSASQLSQLGTVIGVKLQPVTPLGTPSTSFRTSPTKKTGFVPFALPEFPFYSDPQLSTTTTNFEGPLFVDVNGDSQVDMVFSRTNSWNSGASIFAVTQMGTSKTQYVALNTGEGFAYAYRCNYNYYYRYEQSYGMYVGSSYVYTTPSLTETTSYSGDCAAD